MPKSRVNGEDFVRTAEAGRIIGVSSETVRLWANAGRLRVVRIADGSRLFSRADCDRMRRARDERHHTRTWEPVA